MARKLYSDEEREEIIKLVGNLYLSTDLSIRELKLYLEEIGIFISIATVHDYIKRYEAMYPKDTYEIEKKISNNSDKVTEEDIQRVYIVANMIKDGLTIEEISEQLDTSYWTIYRDINLRLKRINEPLYEEVKQILLSNSISNLVPKNK